MNLKYVLMHSMGIWTEREFSATETRQRAAVDILMVVVFVAPKCSPFRRQEVFVLEWMMQNVTNTYQHYGSRTMK